MNINKKSQYSKKEYWDEYTRGSTQVRHRNALINFNAVIRHTISCADSKVVESKTKYEDFSKALRSLKMVIYNPYPYRSFDCFD